MKRRERASKSTYRAILHVQRERDERSGLYVSDRYFEPEKKPARHSILWYLFDAFMIICIMSGLMLLIASGFMVPVSSAFFPAILGLCLLIVFLTKNRIATRYPFAAYSVLLVVYLVVLFVFQNLFISGFRELIDLVITKVNKVYKGDLNSYYNSVDARNIEGFLLLVAVAMILWLSASVFRANQALMAYLLIFPLVALIALCGAAGSVPALFLLLLGVVLLIASVQIKRQLRMWGGNNNELYEKNRIRYESIQKKSAAIVLIVSIVLFIPGYIIARPFLSVSLAPMQEYSTEVQSAFLSKALKTLPEISAGKWNLSLEATSGGVSEGNLGEDDGYLLNEVEDLRLTLNKKPIETIFLKGFIGTSYSNGSWKGGIGSSFDASAINWNIDGDKRLYIQNLPYLRMAYALSQKDTSDLNINDAMAAFDISPVEIFVERVHANESYTYVPYGAFLNDYYEIEAGDGSVTGQSEQEDRYYFYFRSDLEKVFEVWNSFENNANLLDRLEENYGGYASGNKSLDGFSGLDGLFEEIEAVKEENDWKAGKNNDEISVWITEYLNNNFEYEKTPGTTPVERDPLEYFINTSHKGNSVLFASLAVAMYRGFDVPARYVIGYELSEGSFIAQAGGRYTATVKGDNSQAWVEIYYDGIGWMPIDVVPGSIGSLEEVGPGGTRVDEDTNTPNDNKPDISKAPAADISGEDGTVIKEPRMTVGEVIKLISAGLSLAIILLGVIYYISYYCGKYGYDLFGRRSYLARYVVMFQYIYRRIIKLGLNPSFDSQSVEFYEFIAGRLGDDAVNNKFVAEVDKLYRSVYGGREVDESDILSMRSLVKAIYKCRKAK